MSDEVIWNIINNQFCSFKIKTDKGQNFCSNEYNVTGLCSRKSCPLANAKYATVKNVNGKLYLYMKTAERAHMPNRLWERIKLSRNYKTALQQISDHLLYWDKFTIHKCKQRLTRLTQVMIMERRMALTEQERHYVPVKHKVKNRERARERKALAAAKIEKAIEKELMERLKSGAYGEKPLNVDEKVWAKIMGKMEDENADKQEEVENEMEEELELESGNEDDEDVGRVEYVEGNDDDEDQVDMEDLEKWLEESSNEENETSSSDEEDASSSKRKADSDKSSRKRRRAKPRIEVEIEEENEEPLTNIQQ